MGIHRHWPKLIALFAAIAALLGVMAWSETINAASGARSAPSRPPWVRDNGTLDRTKLPACLNIVGPDGQQVNDQSGKPLCANPFELPVTEPEADVKQRSLPNGGGQVPWQRPPGAPAGPNDPPKR